MSPVTALRRRLAGHGLLPGEPGYDELCRPFNSGAPQRPALAVAAAGADDVAAAVRFAVEQGKRVAPQTTGHGAAGVIGDDVVLIDTRRLDEVAIDAGRCVATVGAGATWGAVAAAAAPAGLAGLAGTAPGVGVAGYALHGGVGWLARAHGLASAALLAVEYVDADGVARRTDETEDPEALWAFRGGGGVGVVTRLELRLWPHARFHGGARFWPLDQAPRVLDRWLAWTATAPDSLTSLAWAFQPPGGPAMLALGVCGSDPVADRSRIDDLYAGLPEPLQDTVGERTAAALGEIQGGPPGPLPTRGDGRLLRRPDAGLAAELVRASGVGRGAGAALSVLELRHLGGRAAEASAAGALTALPGEFALAAVGMVPGPAEAAAVDAALDELAGAAAPADLGRTIAGFRGGHTDAPGALEPAARDRLRELQRRRDPTGRLRRARDLTAG